MSKAAPRSNRAPRATAGLIPMSDGTSARAFSLPLPEPVAPPAPERSRTRTPLSLVVSTPRRGRQQLLVIVFMVIVAALAVILAMSISVTKGQYELVTLKNHQADLIKANQTLEQEIAAKAAPQELVASAAALGMVPADSTGQIDVRNKKVSGTPQPAKADTKGLVVIPPADVDKPREVPASSLPPAEAAPADTPANPAAAEGKDEKAAPKAEKAAQVPAKPAGPDLNGGTIPAPAEQDG